MALPDGTPNTAARTAMHEAGLVASKRPTISLAPIPRVAVTRSEAAAALGMSLDSFERYVQPDLRMVRRGSIRLVPVTELARWVADTAEKTL